MIEKSRMNPMLRSFHDLKKFLRLNRVENEHIKYKFSIGITRVGFFYE